MRYRNERKQFSDQTDSDCETIGNGNKRKRTSSKHINEAYTRSHVFRFSEHSAQSRLTQCASDRKANQWKRLMSNAAIRAAFVIS